MKKASPVSGADPRSVRDDDGPTSGDGPTSMHPEPIERPRALDASRIRLIAELARGGMGNVYLAATRGLGGFHKLVVIKELKAEFVDDQAYVAMFLEEARLAARLSHPNIVQTNEIISQDNRYCMVMEYLEGRSLDRVVRRLSRHGGLPDAVYLRVVSDLLQALDYAHRLSGFGGEGIEIVHRDVSPPNVMITFDGQTKLLDFGVAKATDSTLETQSGVLKGRIAYMAPEQARGEAVDRRADVYSAGVMIWEAIAGRRLWSEKTNVEILLHLLNESPPRLRSIRPDAPADLDAICARALARKPEDRYPSAAALHDDLQEHLRRRRDLLPARDVGALVARAFAEETQRLRAMIDEAMAGAAPSDRVPSLLGPTLTTGTFSIGRRDLLGESISSSRASVAPQHSAGSPQHSTASRSSPPPLPRSSPPEAVRRPAPEAPRSAAPPAASRASIAPTHTLPSFEPPQAVGPRPKVPSWLVPAAVAMAIGASLAVVAGNERDRWRGSVVGDPAPGPVAAPPAAPVDRASAAAVMLPVIETIDIDVRVTPRTAQITVDDIEAPTNPFHARLRKDGKTHRIAASAEGYETKIEDVTFAGDVAVDMGLDRRAGPPVHRPPPRAVKPAPEAARDLPAPPIAPPISRMESAPPEERTVQRAIVTANPYGAP